ncbi:hypothetical protein [Terriglobus aquaticus]|uniref:Uncharacterized protein n=1 Tax=Terriglobus aquaticus TaxID=940139 RepID=A0ABW9KI73_9BACT|nr:hypothetical protein [Terriglobus aquaticus]
MSQTATMNERERIEQILHPRAEYTPRQFARSILWVLAVPLAVYLLTFPLVMMPGSGFSRLGVSKFGPVLDYGYNVRHADADVVIFGDSSAFIGIDPRVVNATLGTKALVIPNTIGSLPVLGDIPLQRYLSHNRPPRLLVLYFAPWNLDYNDPRRHDLLFEGEEVLFRHGSLRDILRFAMRKPAEFLTFPLKVYSTLGWNTLSFTLHQGDREHNTDATLGHMDYAFDFPPMPDTCHLVAHGMWKTGDASVRALMQKLSTPQTQVKVYLAPIPGCSDALYAVEHMGQPIGAKPLILPPSWFAGDDANGHIRPDHVAENSLLFAKTIAPWVQQAHIGANPAP